MSIVLIVHLIALGVWMGVVGAEFAIEFDGMESDESYLRAAKLHYITDIYVEIPAFTLVALTGLLMINESHLSGVFLYKVIFSVLAIFFNVVCVYAVLKRRRFSLDENIEGMRSTGAAMKVGALVIPTFIIAFGLAVHIAW